MYARTRIHFSPDKNYRGDGGSSMIIYWGQNWFSFTFLPWVETSSDQAKLGFLRSVMFR